MKITKDFMLNLNRKKMYNCVTKRTLHPLEKISKKVDFSRLGKQCIVLPAKWTFFRVLALCGELRYMYVRKYTATQRVRKFKKVQAKKLMKSNK